jgi:VIT1/CCC1 family predicted Fe2+/Mn2+ transporter
MFAADRVQDLLRRLREDVAALIHSEIDLAKTEVIEKIKMLAFLFGAIAVLALAVPLWASALIVGGALLFVALVFALLGVRSVRKAGLPTPDEAIVEAKATVEDLKEARTA